MKRRFFFSVFSGSFVFPSFLKWSDLNRDTLAEGADSSKSHRTNASKETVVHLEPGQVFVLPEKVEYLKTFVFINEGQDWTLNPPVVKSNNLLLAGKNEPVLVDQNASFGFKFMGKKEGWTLVSV
ncbi:MAG: hypothetical protein JNM24_15535 [Bdellovibrionaceae bacterium]|jgi:hypothetical protein|nr:hypothetical protein [Pseudobdellovibrionaceae bacterium]